MALHQRNPGQLLAPVLIVAVLAGQIELALARRIELAARRDERLRLFVLRDRDRKPARLPADVGGEREQIAALVRERLGLLLFDAAQIDALLDIDWASVRRTERRIARGYAAHRSG